MSVRSASREGVATGTPGLQPAIFLDFGGVICRTDFVPRSADELDQLLVPEALDAIAALGADPTIRIFVLTNQASIDLGELSEATVRSMLERLALRIAERGGRLDAIYYCPASNQTQGQHPPGEVSGRKPAPGMLLAAARDFGESIDLADSFVVGDTWHDFAAARAAGASIRTVRVRAPGPSCPPRGGEGLEADAVFPDLASFVASRGAKSLPE